MRFRREQDSRTLIGVSNREAAEQDSVGAKNNLGDLFMNDMDSGSRSLSATKKLLEIGGTLYDKNGKRLCIYAIKDRKTYKQIVALHGSYVEYYDSFQIGREIFWEEKDCVLQKTILRKDPRYIDFFEEWDKCSKKIHFSPKAVPRSEQYEQKHYLEVISEVKKIEKQIIEKNGGSVAHAEFFAKRGQNDYFREIRQIEARLSEPFFARIDYKEENGVYIGKNEITQRVIDWTDERAALYYEYQLYVADENYGLTLVRNFDVGKGGLKSFSDLFSSESTVEEKKNERISENIIADPHLMKILESGRKTKQVHDIIHSIQANQYRIITAAFRDPFVLLGCAGSGKTMVLYHRIRYMMRNDASIKPDDVIILSPTGILNTESDVLTQTLQLERVKKYSTNSLYASLIEKFFEEREIYYNKGTSVTTSDKADELSDKIYKVIYTASFFSAVTDHVKRILSCGSKDNAAFIQEAGSDIEQMLRLYFDKDGENLLPLVANDNDIKRLLKAYENAKGALQSASKESVEVERVRLENAIQQRKRLVSQRELECQEKHESIAAAIQGKIAEIEKTEAEIKLDKEERKKLKIKHRAETKNEIGFLSTLLLRNNSFSLEEEIEKKEKEIKQKQKGVTQAKSELESMKREIDKLRSQLSREKENAQKLNDELNGNLKYLALLKRAGCMQGENKYEDYQSIYRFVDLLEKYKIQGQINLKYEIDDTLVNTFDIINSVIKDAENFLKFRDGKKQDLYFDRVFEYVMHIQKKELRLSRAYRYHFELFAKLYVLHSLFGVIEKSEKIICVDEFQDYSALELELLKEVFPTSVFNYYGDYFQCINPKGISAESMLPKCMQNITEYQVSENYRNAQNITEYINERFGMDMLAIGIKGQVSHSKNVPFSEADIQSNDRLAIIYSEASDLEKYNIDEEDTMYYFAQDDESSLRSDKINVLSVRCAKGLEFEKVAVIQSKMTDNELYVAMSRALNMLILME